MSRQFCESTPMCEGCADEPAVVDGMCALCAEALRQWREVEGGARLYTLQEVFGESA